MSLLFELMEDDSIARFILFGGLFYFLGPTVLHWLAHSPVGPYIAPAYRYLHALFS